MFSDSIQKQVGHTGSVSNNDASGHTRPNRLGAFKCLVAATMLGFATFLTGYYPDKPQDEILSSNDMSVTRDAIVGIFATCLLSDAHDSQSAGCRLR